MENIFLPKKLNRVKLLGDNKVNQGAERRGKKIMDVKKIVSEDTEKELTKIIIRFVREKGLTISNVYKCVDCVDTFMRNNAVLEKEDLE